MVRKGKDGGGSGDDGREGTCWFGLSSDGVGGGWRGVAWMDGWAKN